MILVNETYAPHAVKYRGKEWSTSARTVLVERSACIHEDRKLSTEEAHR